MPQLVFLPGPELNLTVGGLHLGAASSTHTPSAASASPSETLTPAEVTRRLRGQVLRLDHFGVNLPTAAVDRPVWEDLLQRLAAVAALYRYPNEEWPFVLPASAEELAGEISSFVAGRDPKFELVYDGWTTQPLIQIDVETRMQRAEAEARFPEGVALPGLEELFRSVYLAHPWPNLLVRLDLRFGGDEPSEWDTGEWLVGSGGRIRA